MWDTITGKQIASLNAQTLLWAAAFSPDGTRVVTASTDKTARIWDTATTKEIATLPHNGVVWDASFSRDGSYIVTASADGTVRLWAAPGIEKRIIKQSGRLGSFSADSKYVVTEDDKTAHVYDLSNDQEIAALQHGEQVDGTVFSPDGARVLTASKAIRIWHVVPAEQIITFPGDKGLFSPDGKRVVSWSFDTVTVWDAFSGKEIAVLRGHEGRVNSVGFNRNGSRIVTASADTTVRVCDSASGKQIRALRGHEISVRLAAFSPDGSWVISVPEGSFQQEVAPRIWDAETGRQIATLPGHQFAVVAVAFSSDDAHAATASSDSVHVWDLANKQETLALRQAQGAVQSISFSPDGRRLMTSIAGDMKIPDGPTNRIASIWDVASGRLVMKGIVEDQYSGPAALSPDGRLIAMTSDDKTMHIWDVHTATMSVRDLLTEVCTRRLRGMTRLGRDEMRLIGHPDTLPEIDVCDGIR